MIVIGLFFCLVSAVACFAGDFPLNDDWTYGEAVRLFLQDGRLYMPAACAFGFPHIFWGSIFAKLFGCTYVALRFSSITAGAVGACLAYLVLVELGIHRRESLFCALVYAVNPIMVNLYLSYMTDMPTLGLEAGYLLCLVAGLKRKSLKLLALALVLLILAISIRQSTVVLALAAPALLFAQLGSLRRRVLLAVVFLILPLFAFWAVDNWLVVRDATGQSLVDHYARARIGHGSFLLAFFQTPLDQCLKSLAALGVVACYIGLFTTPIVLGGLVASLVGASKAAGTKAFLTRCRPALPALAASISLCLFSAYFETVVLHRLMPFEENILRFTSVGALGIMGIANAILTARQKVRLTIVSFLLASLVLATLGALILLACAHVKRLRARGTGTGGAPAFVWQQSLSPRLVALIGCFCATLGFLSVETIVRCTDRYYLLALLPSILAMAYFGRAKKIHFASPFGVCLLVLLASYSLCAGQDYLTANAARWRALTKLEGQGIKSASIDGGAEYNILRDMNVYASHYRGEPPRDNWRWWPIKGEEYIVSFSPIPDYEEKWHETYYSFLTVSEHRVYVLEHLKLNK